MAPQVGTILQGCCVQGSAGSRLPTALPLLLLPPTPIPWNMGNITWENVYKTLAQGRCSRKGKTVTFLFPLPAPKTQSSLNTLRSEYHFHGSKHNLLLQLVQLKRLGARLPPKLSVTAKPQRGITNRGGVFGLWQNYSLPFLFRTENSGNARATSSLCSLYKVLNVICALHPESNQKILTIMKKKEKKKTVGSM